MALLSPPTGATVWARARRLDPDHFEDTETEQDVIDMIDADILPDIVRKVNVAADRAAEGNDFPLSEELVYQAYPSYDSTQVTEMIANQQADFKEAIVTRALHQLYDLVDSTEAWYTTQSDRYKKLADEALKHGIESVQEVVKRTTAPVCSPAASRPRSGSVSVQSVF